MQICPLNINNLWLSPLTSFKAIIKSLPLRKYLFEKEKKKKKNLLLQNPHPQISLVKWLWNFFSAFPSRKKKQL